VVGALGGAFVGVQLSQECAEFCEGNYLCAQPFEVAVASAIGLVVGLVVGYMPSPCPVQLARLKNSTSRAAPPIVLDHERSISPRFECLDRMSPSPGSGRHDREAGTRR
jgi:hypothetical protein